MANILLFNPPTPGKKFTREGRCTQESGIWGTLWPPITLATAAALLERDGHRVRIFDFPAINGDPDSLRVALRQSPPDFAFWSTGTPTLESDLKIAVLIKDLSPRTVTGVMGTHVTVQPEQALAEAAVDLVIRREPDAVIMDICRHGSDGWRSLNGISYRNAAGGITHNPDADFMRPEDIPAPAWHLLPRHPYVLPLRGEPFLIVAPIRGCPYPCSFCTAAIYYGKKLRRRPIENVVAELENNIERYDIRNFFIWADTFTADRDYVNRFCQEIIRRKLDISWTCNSRVDTVDRETLAIMKQAGLWMISFGLESGNEEILQRSGKGITTKQAQLAVKTAHELGIKVAGHFILGLPGETEQTLQQTINFSLNMPLDIAQFYTASPFPGTRLNEQALASGWLKNSDHFSQGSAVLELPDLSTATVNAFRDRAYKKFYLRHRIMLRLFSLLRPKAYQHLFNSVGRFLRWTLTRNSTK